MGDPVRDYIENYRKSVEANISKAKGDINQQQKDANAYIKL